MDEPEEVADIDVTIETNPNALSDEDILKILRTDSKMAWEEWLSTLDSIATLRRMLDLAELEGGTTGLTH